MMTTLAEEQLVRRALLEWAQHQTHSVKIRCDIIAINLARLASDPHNLTLRRTTMTHVASLAAALYFDRAGKEWSALATILSRRLSSGPGDDSIIGACA